MPAIPSPPPASAPLLPEALPRDDAAARALIARIDQRLERRVVRAGGHAVVFRRTGSGAPLVLVHGGHGSWLHWVRNLDALGARHTLWLPDMPGYGDSDALAAPADLEHLAAALAAALGEVFAPGEAIDVAGFSFGGLVAAHAVAARLAQGGAVRRVALLGTSGHGTTRRDRLRMRDWKHEPDPAARDRLLAYNLGVLMLHDAAAIDPLALALHRQSAEATRFRSKGYATRAVIQPALDTIAAHGVPLLLAWGEHDVTATPHAIGAALAAEGQERQWRVLPGAGHWVQYESPRETEALLLDWFM